MEDRFDHVCGDGLDQDCCHCRCNHCLHGEHRKCFDQCADPREADERDDFEEDEEDVDAAADALIAGERYRQPLSNDAFLAEVQKINPSFNWGPYPAALPAQMALLVMDMFEPGMSVEWESESDIQWAVRFA